VRRNTRANWHVRPHFALSIGPKHTERERNANLISAFGRLFRCLFPPHFVHFWSTFGPHLPHSSVGAIFSRLLPVGGQLLASGVPNRCSIDVQYCGSNGSNYLAIGRQWHARWPLWAVMFDECCCDEPVCLCFGRDGRARPRQSGQRQSAGPETVSGALCALNARCTLHNAECRLWNKLSAQCTVRNSDCFTRKGNANPVGKPQTDSDANLGPTSHTGNCTKRAEGAKMSPKDRHERATGWHCTGNWPLYWRSSCAKQTRRSLGVALLRPFAPLWATIWPLHLALFAQAAPFDSTWPPKATSCEPQAAS